MMGRLNHDQRQLFYSFSLEEAVPDDHLVRKIAAVLDLSWVHAELAPHYPNNGRPSIDPELMIRMLIISYVFAIRSERSLCRDVQVNLAYRWFCGCHSACNFWKPIDIHAEPSTALSRAHASEPRGPHGWRPTTRYPLLSTPRKCGSRNQWMSDPYFSNG